MGRKIATLSIAFLILFSCSISVFHTYQVKETLLQMISEAKEAAEENNKEKALELSEKITNYWEQEEQILILYVNHTEADSFTDLVASLSTLVEYDDITLFCSELDEAYYTIEHLWTSQLPLPQNIL